MEDHPVGREEYIQKVLSAYRQTPGTVGTIRRPDRLLAAPLYARGVPLRAVENAFVLAASRRIFRPTEAPPLGTIRSLAYFLPVIDEVLSLTVSQDYFRYLCSKIAEFYSNPPNPPTNCRRQSSTLLPLYAFGVG